MSDSILYLAIVAIWAGFLIPAWVRRPQTSKYDLDAETEESGADAQPAEHAAVREVVAETAEVEFEADVRVDADGEDSEYRYDVHMHGYRTASSRPGAVPAPASRRPAPGSSQSREQMMRARRRMLTILTSLVFITAAFVVAGLVRWWISAPPIALLVLYVLLLREIAMADAELARKRTAWEARAARDVWRRAHQAWEADRETAAEPTAKIIDISSRVGDQLYDQYADAAVRAVGD